MQSSNNLLQKIPHCKPFRFIDEIIEIDHSHIIGQCFLQDNSFFYLGHFPENPITPGFIITEIMAQIGILGLGIFLVGDSYEKVNNAFLASANVKFHNVSYPNDNIIVKAEKVYFKFNTLKCYIEAFNSSGILLCSGTMVGIIN